MPDDMQIEQTRHSKRSKLSRKWQLRALLAMSLIWLGPTLACGSFAPRPTPTPTPPPVETAVVESATATPIITLSSTPVPPALPRRRPRRRLPPLPSTPVPGTALAVGQPARVVAPDGLNMRDQAEFERPTVAAAALKPACDSRRRPHRSGRFPLVEGGRRRRQCRLGGGK